MDSDIGYDVFLSFRGRDTLLNFTGHLYAALDHRNLRTFINDMELQRGEQITRQLLTAIQRSRISVIVFSKDYASSRWGLDELVWIMEGWKTQDRLVLPVFHGVDPSEIRKQNGTIGAALQKHYRSGRIAETTMRNWREALTQAANISGWNSGNDEYDGELILDIVKSIQSKGLPTRLNISIYPLRYDICDDYLRVFLQAGSQDVLTVGICGPSQMGKTAMARVMYDQILQNFYGGCFLADISQRSHQFNYLVRLQETLLSVILSETVKISNDSHGMHLIEQKLSSKRVLVVLDNVDDFKQMYALVGVRSCFGLGSKIIITTRNVQLLEGFGVDQFILAQGRPLPQNVGAIWEPYQRSRCLVAGLKEYTERFTQQRQEKMRYLEAVLLKERQRNGIQEKVILELLEGSGEASATTACTVTTKRINIPIRISKSELVHSDLSLTGIEPVKNVG